MAEGGMTSADRSQSPALPHWIVLTPSADDAAWRDALRRGVEAFGCVLRDGDREAPASTDDPTREVWLTSDLSVAESLGRQPIAALVPRPETSPEAVTEALGLFPPHSMAHASLLIARAVSQDPRRCRIVTDREIRAARGAPIQLVEGLSVTPPEPAVVDAVRPAVRVALEAFSGGAPAPGDSIIWSERIFRYDQRASRTAQQLGELDITGRPRILVYGPYMGMPQGRWRARVKFLVDAPAAAKELRIDWGSPHDFTSLQISTPHAGVYEAELEHDWPAVDLAEIRLWLMEGAFDGVLHFLGATITNAGRPLANAA
jgi:hypothetical protein